MGKLLLSMLAPDEVKARLGMVDLERFTEKTITDYACLVNELDTIRHQGYAIDNQEIIPGGICVAAPIIDKTNRTVAAISVTMAAMRWTEETIPNIIGKVCSAANYVSARLGKIQ
jgi:DNA-binding IclR family transcriptional regulator